MSTLNFPLNYSYNIRPQDLVTKLPDGATSIYGYYKGYNGSNVPCPLFDTSNVTNMQSMFNGVSSATAPLLDTSNVTNMESMFESCSYLITVPLFDTSNVTSMRYMFSSCSKLTTVPLFDTSNVTNMESMFRSDSRIYEIPKFDTSKVTNMNYMFYGSGIVTIPELDCSSVTTIQNMFNSSSGNGSIVNVGGFKNLGMQQSFTSGNNFMPYAQYITHDSLMNIINNLYDRATAGYSTVTLKFHANALAKLTDEEKAIATNKGWTIS